MAANSNSGKDNDDHSEENPFVSFRRYADSQFASMLDGILGLPQTLYQKGHEHGRGLSQRAGPESEPQTATTGPEKVMRRGGYGRDSDGDGDDDEDRDDRRADEEDDNWDTGDWNKLAERLLREVERGGEGEREMPEASPAAAREDAAGRDRSDGERGWAEWFWGTDADPRTTAGKQNQIGAESRTCPYRRSHEEATPHPPPPFPLHPFGTIDPTPVFTPTSSLFILPSLIFRGPGTNFEMLPYLFLSPYSPLHLERDPHLGQMGTPRWRTAFEDLCRASQGRELTGEKEWERIERGSGVEWVAGLVPGVEAAEGMRRPGSGAKREEEEEEEEDVDAWDPVSAVRKMLDDGGMENRLLQKIAALRQEAERVDAEWSQKPEGQSGADQAQRDVPQPQSAIGRFLADSIVEGESRILQSVAAARQEAERLGAEWTQELERWSGHASQEQRQTPNKPSRPAQDDEPKFANDAFTEPATELDAYERLLGLRLHDRPATTPGADDKGTPSVLSTLTTTERRVSPDGSVTTKVVLRKRFADGTEETEETVHTMQGQGKGRGQAQRSRIESGDVVGGERGGQVEQDGGDEGRKGRRGWFWSG